MSTLISGTDIQDMVAHWLSTPIRSYLGSDYGQDSLSLLQLPQGGGSADQYIAKLKTDIPLLSTLPPGTVNLFSVPTPPDKMNIVLGIGGATFTIG